MGIEVGENGTLGGRSRESLDDALTYWNVWSPRYGDYAMRFEIDNETYVPDIVVRFVGDILSCGELEDPEIAGCAPIIYANTTIRDRPVYVYIESGWEYCETREIIKHEFGHVLGLHHDDEPQPLMKEDAGENFEEVCG